MTESTKLAEMLCTRLCHDLTGPIGAVNNGAEFLQEDDDEDNPNEALALILSSAQEAVHRLQFYRQAYGRITEGGTMALNTHYTIVMAFFSNTKITIDWPGDASEAGRQTISQALGRLLLNLCIVAMGGMLKGGAIRIELKEEAGERLVEVSANGELMKYDPKFLQLLNGESDSDPEDPKIVQFLFVKALSDDMGAGLQASYNETDGLLLRVRVVDTKSTHSA